MSIKWQRWSNWIKKGGPTVCCLKGIHFKFRNTDMLQLKAQKKCNANQNQKDAVVKV